MYKLNKDFDKTVTKFLLNEATYSSIKCLNYQEDKNECLSYAYVHILFMLFFLFIYFYPFKILQFRSNSY